jgi:hypothetical protein
MKGERMTTFRANPGRPTAVIRRALHVMMLLTAIALTPSTNAQLATNGELLLDEDFRTYATYTVAKQPVKDGWQVRMAHGIWTRTADGVQSNWEPGKHSPVLVYEGDFNDVVVEVDFRFQAENGRWAGCRLSATNHTLNPRAYAASVWANVDFKSRAVGLVLEHDEWSPGPIIQVNRAMTDLKPDTWYTLRLEIVGETAFATVNGVVVKGSFSKFGIPKTSLWIGTGECPHELRHLRIYRAQPLR